jgi:hypothetical protein
LSVLIALGVGVIAFAVGLHVGGAPSSGPAAIVATSPQPTPSAGASTALTNPAVASVVPFASPPGWSDFVRTFDATRVIEALPGGATCVGGSPGTWIAPSTGTDPDGTFVKTWLTSCPIALAQRDAFLSQVVGAIAPVDNPIRDGAGGVMAVTPYEEGGFVGSVALTARASADGLEIAITLEERPAPSAGPTFSGPGVSPGTAQAQGPATTAPVPAPTPSTATTLRLPLPSPLPAGRLGRLAYSLNGHIYLADWDGRNPIRIADGAPLGPAPCNSDRGSGLIWSPDGRHLAYFSGCGTVVIYDVVTKAVASFPGEGWLISWSPDSTHVATWVAELTTIGIDRVDGGLQAVFTVPPGCAEAGDYDMRWSPDGTSLVGRDCEVPVDGRTPASLQGDDPRSHSSWVYSPDGTRVAYLTAGSVAGASLAVAAADGSQARVLVPIGVGLGEPGLVWSPTGDRIAFTAGSYSEPKELRVVDVASGTVAKLAAAPGTDSLQVVRFSPEGDRILFSRMDANAVGMSLWTVRADGSDAQLLVTGTGWGDWQWQPRGP